MKIGYSTLAAPEWSLEEHLTQAKSLGFDGLELRGIQGQLHLPLVPALAADPAKSAELFTQNQVELICLGSSSSFGSMDRTELARNRTELIETIELAESLHCPRVRLFTGEVPARTSSEATLCRIAAELTMLAGIAARHQVTLVVENNGDYLSSRDLWFLVDAVSLPSLKVCWNPCNAMPLGERSTIAIPRLASKLDLIHVTDAEFDSDGRLIEYRLPGQGEVDWAKAIELLRGVIYRGYLVFEWPKLWVPSLPEPASVLADVAKYLRSRIDHRDPVLTAYKGDKQKPNYPSLGGASAATETSKH